MPSSVEASDGIRIIVHPESDFRYGNYLLRGLHERLPQGRISLGRADFPATWEARRPFAAIVSVAAWPKAVKIYFDADDMVTLPDDAYRWADVVVKTNVNEETPNPGGKLLVAGPTLGIPFLHSWMYLGHRLVQPSPVHLLTSLRKLRGERTTRLPAYVAKPNPGRSLTYFHLDRYWVDEKSVNDRRRDFHLYAQKKGYTVFGGFVDAPLEYPQHPRISHRDYVEQLKSSAIAFVTPAVHDCWGWKYAEALSLGKAIISTGFPRILPVEDSTRDAVHEIDSRCPDSVGRALERFNSSGYRVALAEESCRRFRKVYSPVALAKRVLERCEKVQ